MIGGLIFGSIITGLCWYSWKHNLKPGRMGWGIMGFVYGIPTLAFTILYFIRSHR